MFFDNFLFFFSFLVKILDLVLLNYVLIGKLRIVFECFSCLFLLLYWFLIDNLYLCVDVECLIVLVEVICKLVVVE